LVDASRNDPRAADSRCGPPGDEPVGQESRREGARAVVDPPGLKRPFRRPAPGGMAALFSCLRGEVAFESPGLKHGVFFHFVITALAGEADVARDGQVDLEELSHFVKRRVSRFVNDTYYRDQTPELICRTRGSVAIVGQ